MAMVYIFGTLLTAGEKLKWLNVVAVIGVLLNITLNFVLIPTHGALGATYATLITQFGTAMVQIIMALAIFKIANNRKASIPRFGFYNSFGFWCYH